MPSQHRQPPLALVAMAMPVLLLTMQSAAKSSACHLLPGRRSMRLSCSDNDDELAERLLEKPRVETDVELMGLRLRGVTRIGLRPLERRVSAVTIDSCGLARIAQSESHFLMELQRLSIVAVEAGGLGGLDKMVALNLSNNIITSVSFTGLQQSLRILDLSGNRISSLGKDAFCSLEQLRALDLSRNPLLETYAIPQLKSLQFLRASIRLVRSGTFCRMHNLQEVDLVFPIKVMHCYVFDSLPRLKELKFNYKTGPAAKICQSMLCTPHPVLNATVPFNFTITRINGTDKEVVRNLYVSSDHFSGVCKKYYRVYQRFSRRENRPLLDGCYESDQFKCPVGRMVRCRSQEIEAHSTAGATSRDTSTVPELNSSLRSTTLAATSQTFTENTNIRSSTQTAAEYKTVTSTFATHPTEFPTEIAKPDGAIESRRSRLSQLNGEIRSLEGLIVIIYSFNGILILLFLALLWRLMRLLRREKGNVESLRNSRQLVESLTSGNGYTESVPTDRSHSGTQRVPCSQPEAGPLFNQSEEYVPMKGTNYIKLPEHFANPSYRSADQR